MTPQLSKNLKANLGALLSRNPSLAERVCLSVENDHVRGESDGSVSYRYHREWFPLDLSTEQIGEALDGLDNEQDILVFGLGTGDLLDATLKRWPEATVVGWEQDPWLLREVLERRDYSKAIISGRLILAMGMDVLDFVPAIKLGAGLACHPFLAQVYTDELRLLQEGRGEKSALVCAGGLMVGDVAEALRAEGYSTATWNIHRLSEEELRYAAQRLQPSLVAAINYSHGLAEACEDAALPLLVWEIDPSTDRLKTTPSTSTAHIFTYRKANQSDYRNAGFKQVEYLPLAANTERRQPTAISAEAEDRYRCQISFVGNSMVELGTQHRARFVQLFHEANGSSPDAEGDANALIQAVLTEQAKDWCDFRVPELVQQMMPEFAQKMAIGDPADHPITLLSEMAAADKRLSLLAPLGQVGVRLWGDQGWQDLAEFGCRYMGPAGHREELNRIYSNSLINLDIGRIYQSDIVTMRVFDVLACGGFILTEHCEALSEVFDIGSEVESYSSMDEMIQKIEHYLEHPDEARAIGERGRQRVLRDHSIASRVRYMLSAAGLRDAANN